MSVSVRLQSNKYTLNNVCIVRPESFYGKEVTILSRKVSLTQSPGYLVSSQFVLPSPYLVDFHLARQARLDV